MTGGKKGWARAKQMEYWINGCVSQCGQKARAEEMDKEVRVEKKNRKREIMSGSEERRRVGGIWLVQAAGLDQDATIFQQIQ